MRPLNIVHWRTLSILFTVLVFLLTVDLIYQARRPLSCFIFAILLAYLINPLITGAQRGLRSSRRIAIATTYLLLGIVVGGLGMIFAPPAISQAKRLGQELPGLIERVDSGEIAQQYGRQQGWDSRTQLLVQRFLRSRRDVLKEYAEAIDSHAAALAGNLMWVLLVPILAAFLLDDPLRFTNTLLGLVRNAARRDFLRALLNNLDLMLAMFIRAQLSLAAIGLVAYTSFLLLVRFPYAFALGAMAGPLEFIPFVGPIITAVLILGVAALTGYPHWPAVFLFLVFWRGIEDYAISPYLMGRGLKLHPLALVCGALVGGEIGGIMGLFLSVPILAGARIVWKALEPQLAHDLNIPPPVTR